MNYKEEKINNNIFCYINNSTLEILHIFPSQWKLILCSYLFPTCINVKKNKKKLLIPFHFHFSLNALILRHRTSWHVFKELFSPVNVCVMSFYQCLQNFTVSTFLYFKVLVSFVEDYLFNQSACTAFIPENNKEWVTFTNTHVSFII